MKIAVIPAWYPSDESPYAGSFIRAQAQALADSGHDVTVLFPELRSLRRWRPGAGSGELADTSHGNLRVWRWRGFRWWPRERHGSVAFLWAAKRLFYEYVSTLGPPDLIHAHIVLPAGYAASSIGPAWDIPFVLTEQTGPFQLMTQTAWQRWQVRRTMRSAAAVVAVSEFEREALRSAGVDREVTIIPNTLDPAFLPALPPRAPDPQASTRFLAVSSLIPGKGLDDLLRAFAIVHRQQPGASLTIAGGGPLREALEDQARQLGIATATHFLGALPPGSGVRERMGAADVFVHASDSETFGVVLIEAMASGLPVVCTRCGGPEEIVTPEVGRLVARRSPEGLASAMAAVAPPATDEQRAAIRQAALARYAPSVVAAQYTALFERVVSDHRKRP